MPSVGRFVINSVFCFSIFVNNKHVSLAASHPKFVGTLYTGIALKLKAADQLSCRVHYNSQLFMGPTHAFFGAFFQ